MARNVKIENKVESNYQMNVTLSGEEKIAALEREVQNLNADLDSMTQQYEAAAAAAERFKAAADSAAIESGLAALREELVMFKSTASEAAMEFDAFLRAARLTDTNDTGFEKFRGLFNQIEEGSKTAQQAIVEVKQAYASVIEENWSKNGGMFDAQQIQQFDATLTKLGTTLSEVLARVTEMQTQGVQVNGEFASTGASVASTLQQIEAAARNMDDDLLGSYEAIAKLTSAMNEYASIDSGKLETIASTFRNMAKIGEGNFGGKSLSNLTEFFAQAQRLGDGSGTIRLNVSGFESLSGLKTSKTWGDHLTTLGTAVKALNVNKLQSVAAIDFSNLTNFKMSKSTADNLFNLTNAMKQIDQLSVKVKALSDAEAKAASTSKSNSIFAPDTERLNHVTAVLKEIDASMATVTASYKKMLTNDGASTQELDGLREKYIALQEAIDKVRTNKGTASDEDIAKIRQLQTETNQLIESINKRITAEKEAEAAKQKAAADKAAEDAKKEAQAQKEAAEALKQKAQAEKEAASAAKQAETEEMQRANALKQYQTLLSQINSAQRNYSAAAKSTNDASRNAYQNYSNQAAEVERLYRAYQNGEISYKQFSAGLASANASVKASTDTIRANGDAAQTLSQRLSGLASKFSAWLSVSQVIMYSIRAIKDMVNASIELDDAMSQLKIVTNETDSTYQHFADNISKTAQQIGASTKDLVDATTTYARLGYDLSNSSVLAKYTGMLQQVGNIEAQDAQDAMTSMIKAFNLDIGDIESVMDRLVAVGNGAPISVSQIAEAMTNASSTMAAAGNDLNQTIALMTAANTTLQNASRSSTGLRTITARIRKTKTELDDLGEALSDSDYNNIIEALSKITLADGTTRSVSLKDANGEYRETYAILSDLAEIWNELDSMTQAGIAEKLAGTRMQDVFYSIMNNWKEAQNAMSLMENPADTLQNSYDKYLETTTAHLQTFKSAFAQLGADTFQTGFLNGIIDFGTALVNIADGVMKVINVVGGLKTVLIGMAGIVATIKADAILAFVTSLPGKIAKLASPIMSLITIISRIPAVYQSMTSGTAVAVQGTSRLTAALQGLGITASAAQLAIGALFAALTIGMMVYSKWKQHQEELRQQAIESAKNAHTESTEVYGLTNEYLELSDAISTNAGARADLAASQDSLIDKLGIEKTRLQELVAEYGNYSDAIRQAAVEKLQEDERDLRGGQNQRATDLVKGTTSWWEGGFMSVSAANKVGMFKDPDKSHYDLYKGLKALEDAGFISPGSYSTYSDSKGNKYSQGFALSIATEQDLSTVEGVVAAYKELGQMLDVVGNTIGQDNSLYTALFNKYSGMTDQVKEYSESNAALNENLAEQYVLMSQSDKLAAQNGMGGLVDVNNPENLAGYVTYRNALIDAAVASGEFAGSQDEVANAIDGVLAQSSGLSQFAAEYAEAQNIFGNNDELIEWYGSLSDADKSIVYSIALSTDTAEYQLQDWQDALSSYEIPEEDKISFSEFFKSDDDGSFKKTVDDYVSQMKVLGDAKEKLLDGSFSDSDLKELIDTFPEYADKFAGGAGNVSSAVDSIMNSLTGHPETVNNISNITDALDNLLNEEQKIKDWGLEDFGSALDTSGNSFIQSQFGNVDMDARTIIAWSDELKTRYRNALDSWDYDPEIGGIDTVFGGSDRFGEDVLEYGVEVAFTPIMNTENGAEFLSKDTVYDYIESLVGASVKDGTFSEDTLLALDKQGMQIGDKFVSGLIAAADEGLNYDNNGNWAETVGRLMHFSGDFGAIAIAMSDVEKEAAAAGMSVEDYINSMSETSEVTEEATGIMKFFDEAIDKCATDEDRAALEAYRDAILSMVESADAADSSIVKCSKSLEDAKTLHSDLQSAISDSNSATGMTSEEVDKVTSSFKNLDNFNPDALFERTENGIRLNVDALKEYNAELEAQTKQGFLDAIIDKQNELNKARANGSSADVISGLEGELRQLQNLAAEYDGLTSKFNAYVTATSSANNRDSFASVAEGYESVGKLIEQGWTTDDSVTSYLDLMLGTDRIQDAQQAYAQLGNTISGTTNSLKDYFTTDSNGALTSQGAWMFVDDIATKLGDSFVSIGEDGSYALDLTGDKLQTVADEFGTTTEFVELLGRALADAGMKVNFDSDEVMNYNEQMKQLTEHSDEAHKALQELQETSAGGIIGDIDLSYDKASMSIDDITSKIEELTNKRNEIDVSTEEGQQAVSLLDSEIQALSNQKVMLEIGAQLEGGATVDELLALSDEDLQKTLHINADEVATAREQLESLTSTEVDVPVTVKLEESQFSALTGTGDTTINVTPVVTEQPTFDDATINVTATCDTPPEVPDATGTANMELGTSPETVPDAEGVANYILGSYPTEAPDIAGVANYTANFNFSLQAPTIYGTAVYTKQGVADGTMTAHADGTAYNMLNLKRITPSHAKGDVALPNDEQALVNEIGQESIVRDGVWYMLPAKPHIENLKKGDIVFSAKQTADLLNHGRANNYARALAGGTLNAYGLTGVGNNPWKTGGSSGGSGNSGGSGSSGGSYSSTSYTKPSTTSTSNNKHDTDDKDTEIIDWIEIAIDRIERAIKNAAVIADSAFQKLSKRLSSINDEISLTNDKIAMEQDAYNRYIKEANSVGLPSDLANKVKNGTIDITEYDKDTADKIKDYQKWYELALDCRDAIIELTDSLGELYQSKFNEVQKDYENQLSLLEHMTNAFNNSMDDIEARGYLATTKLYEAQQKVQQDSLVVLNKELQALTDRMSEGVNSGSIAEGSEAWYEMQQAINDVKEKIQETETEIINLGNSIREVNWSHFDYLQERISDVGEEAQFLIDLLGHSELFTDRGQLTDEGMATMGLYAEKYNIYMAQADKYAAEIQKLTRDIANDPNNTKLLERRQELIEAQRDAILAAEGEKDAIVDLVKDGIDRELSALKELIDTYNESLDSAKNLYDYQKKVKKQTKEIADLQKQLAAYANDTSDETRAKVQKLEVDLSSAIETLEETQYDRYISEQKKLLDDLYSEYEQVLNTRLDDVDALISDMIDTVNTNSGSISDTITTAAADVGYTLSKETRDIWANEGLAFSVVSKYGESITGGITSVKAVLDGIAANVASMIKKSDDTAKKTTDTTKPSTPTNDTGKKTTPTPTPTPTPKKEDTKFNDDVKRGIAAAIWIYGSRSGWGNDPERRQKLTAKFGATNAAAVQSYINAHANNGDLYKYWVSTGKSNLSKYYYSAFKTGGLADFTGPAWLDGTPSDPEIVLNADDSKNFMALKDAMREVANGTSPLSALFGGGHDSDIMDGLSKIAAIDTDVSGGIGDVTYNINIPIDHVEDYEDFMNHMRRDRQFEQLIQSMTVDRLVGGSKIAKNKFKW